MKRHRIYIARMAVLGWLSDLREQVWRWRHRRCIPIRQRRPEYRALSDLDRVCRSCRAAMLDEEVRSAERWS